MTQRFGGKWSKEKLARVEKYFIGYNTALKNQSFTRYYIDTFAGAGGHLTSKDKATDENYDIFDELSDSASEFLVGSPIRALNSKPQFDKFIFSDLLLRNSRELSGLQEEYPDRAIDVRRGDANEITRQIIHEINWKRSRAVLFLDPCGAQVDWGIMEAIAETEAIDMWYLFPTGAVLRMVTKSGDIRAEWREKLNSLLGTTEWENEFYKKSGQMGLFDQALGNQRTVTCESVEDFLVRRLETVFPHVVSQCFTLWNSKNSPLFSLCFAAANPKGGEIACRIASSIIK